MHQYLRLVALSENPMPAALLKKGAAEMVRTEDQHRGYSNARRVATFDMLKIHKPRPWPRRGDCPTGCVLQSLFHPLESDSRGNH
jgi:hypothetical protein